MFDFLLFKYSSMKINHLRQGLLSTFCKIRYGGHFNCLAQMWTLFVELTYENYESSGILT